ncbi:MAG: pilus assembly protein [Selenomonadaceae bacterium]|nr:pilus assembly protein [Selenomonadaceae bacterium]
MIRQRGQSAVEFALMAPLVLFMILAAIYGGAMFIQFMNYSNEARTIAREIAVASDESQREERFNKYKGDAVGAVALYKVSAQTVLWKDNTEHEEYITGADEVEVRFVFHHDIDFIFGFPPKSFAASYRMTLENN